MGLAPKEIRLGVYIERKGFGTLAAGRLNKAATRGAHEIWRRRRRLRRRRRQQRRQR